METEIRFFQTPAQSAFIFGPRGTGKSTWLRKTYTDAIYIDLLIPEVMQKYAAQPSRLREVILAHTEAQVVIIDEIQKLPTLLSLVHSLIEEFRTITFILTGSSSRKLKRSGVDLLAGRALLTTFHPFMAAELGEHFSLESALVHGLVPLVVSSPDPAKTLAGYTALYLQEEVKAEGLVRNVEWFARFLESLSFSHGSPINTSAVARDCGVKTKTVSNYIEIVEDLLLGWQVPIFQKRAKRILSAHPKFYFFDCGVFRALRPSGPLDRPEEIAGPALEGLVAQHLKAWIGLSNNECALYYWRTKSGNEVDFILYGSSEFIAIEVKNTIRIRNEDARGLREFAKDYPEAQTLLLYRGNEKIMFNNVLCIPCQEFLCSIRPGISIGKQFSRRLPP